MKTFYCDISDFCISLKVTFSEESASARIIEAVSGQVSSVRLPKYSFSETHSYPIVVDIQIDASIKNEIVTAAFSGDVDTPQIVDALQGFHWDFWKICIALIWRHLIKTGVVTYHAACIRKQVTNYLLLGHSGAGKSSMAYYARLRQGVAYSSELTFLNGTRFVAGNGIMSIDRDALSALELALAGNEKCFDAKILSPVACPPKDMFVDRIVFPKVVRKSGAPFKREIDARRARMLLYENAIGQMPICQLIDQQSSPIVLIPTEREVETIGYEICKLSKIPAVMLEGTPEEIWAMMSY
jgi:hypothetical protein